MSETATNRVNFFSDDPQNRARAIQLVQKGFATKVSEKLLQVAETGDSDNFWNLAGSMARIDAYAHVINATTVHELVTSLQDFNSLQGGNWSRDAFNTADLILELAGIGLSVELAAKVGGQ